jgi:hypothetical protein
MTVLENCWKGGSDMAKYHIASKNHGADFTGFALVFLAAYLKTSPVFTVDKTDFDAYRTRKVSYLIGCGWVV